MSALTLESARGSFEALPIYARPKVSAAALPGEPRLRSIYTFTVRPDIVYTVTSPSAASACLTNEKWRIQYFRIWTGRIDCRGLLLSLGFHGFDCWLPPVSKTYRQSSVDGNRKSTLLSQSLVNVEGERHERSDRPSASFVFGKGNDRLPRRELGAPAGASLAAFLSASTRQKWP